MIKKIILEDVTDWTRTDINNYIIINNFSEVFIEGFRGRYFLCSCIIIEKNVVLEDINL